LAKKQLTDLPAAEAESGARVVWECPWWRVEEESFRGPDGVLRQWYTARRPNPETVHMLALDAQGRVPLLRQYRVPMRGWVWELPAGLSDPADPSLEETARRELQEETGLFAARIVHLLRATVSPGITDEFYNAFLCLDCEVRAGGGGVHGEQIEVTLVPLGRLEQFVLERAAAGELVDSKIIAHARLAELWLNSKPAGTI
jgi:ADP-ribose pyrophosphatase